MAEVAQLLRAERDRTDRGREHQPDIPHPLYFAFLSYSHRDESSARWLHDELETFRVPGHLVGKLTDHGSVPRRLTPVFRDMKELPASGDLGSTIKSALAASRFLIVLCSPSAAQSKWTNSEIATFKRVHPHGPILAAILDGEPFASDIPGRDQLECLPPALRFKHDRQGRATTKRAEPLAADLRGGPEARRLGFLKLVAGMLGVGLDELIRRDDVRRQKKMAILTAASLAGMVITSALAFVAIQSRDTARDQRREAEGLIGFMVGDLRSKLQPVGRLDALDGVGSRVLAYYQKQDMSDLSDAALSQRSRALGLMGEIANARGDSADAVRLYQAALAGTAEALRRKPDDPQRLFEHAQNIFWIGEIARLRGRSDIALTAGQEYKRLATQMVELEPDNMRWRMETQYADANNGIVLYGQRRYNEALSAFEGALHTIQGLSAADPANRDYRKGLIESLAWLADGQSAVGKLREAVASRQKHIELLRRLIASSGGDVGYREDLIHAFRALGHLHSALGESRRAIENMRAAVNEAQSLAAVERGNRLWIGFIARSRLDLAKVLIASGDVVGAEPAARSGCGIIEKLRARDPRVHEWQTAQRDCLALRAQIALVRGDDAEAMRLSRDAIESAKSVPGGDPVENRYMIARAYRLSGDAKLRAGKLVEAQADWKAGLGALPPDAVERPAEVSEHAELLQRLNQIGAARPLQQRLKAMGYQQRAQS